MDEKQVGVGPHKIDLPLYSIHRTHISNYVTESKLFNPESRISARALNKVTIVKYAILIDISSPDVDRDELSNPETAIVTLTINIVVIVKCTVLVGIYYYVETPTC